MDKKEKKALKKEKKLRNRQKREAIRQKYADEAFIVRFLHVNASILSRIVLICLVFFVIVNAVVSFINSSIFSAIVSGILDSHMESVFSAETTDKIYEMCPIDQEGAERIDQIPGNNEKDTWTFCVYMVGADLEDMGENDLSDYVCLSVAAAASENSSNKSTSLFTRLNRLESEIAENNLDMPKYLYKITKPIASSYYVTEDVVVADEEGCASADIAEMCAYPFPENITIVLQTGGAKRWSNTLVNPNRTQRFVIKNGMMSEDMDMHLQDSCNPDTLADFISYCDKNYHSDHMGLILWDHGGGVTGYGVDRIFDSGMSLKDINTALSKSVEKNDENPYFDLIGFDACLMAATDTAKNLKGYGKYLAASEETEPGDGWNHTAWIKALSENPAMSAARLGREIADSYIDYYLKGNNDPIFSFLTGNRAVTFSVVDIEKAAEVDDAYERMNEKFLKLIAEKQSVLTDMSRCASKTMRYCGSLFSYFNTIDLGTYIDYLSELYPEECREVKNLLKDAVLYTRSNHYLAGSQGLSIYFPVTMDETSSLFVFTDYVYNISDKKYTNALYYYKVAGCLNEEMKKTVNETSSKELKTLNTQLFYDYQKIIPDTSSKNQIVMNIGDDLLESIQSVYVEVAAYDEKNETITYYGKDDCYDFDENGAIVTDVDCQWFALNDSFLDAKVSYTSDLLSTYIAKVLHNGIPSYMTFTMNNITGEITIDRLVKIPDSDSMEYDAALRVDTNLKYGDKIVPVLRVQDAKGINLTEVEGKKVKYDSTTKIELKNLPDGVYLHSVVITDLRGDEYYSPVVEASLKNGKVSSLEVNPEFVGTGN